MSNNNEEEIILGSRNNSFDSQQNNNNFIKEFNQENQKEFPTVSIDLGEGIIYNTTSTFDSKGKYILSPQLNNLSQDFKLRQKISELESLLIQTQAELLNKNKEIDQLKEDVKYQKKRRNSISHRNEEEIDRLKELLKEEQIKFS